MTRVEFSVRRENLPAMIYCSMVTPVIGLSGVELRLLAAFDSSYRPTTPNYFQTI